MTDWSVRFINRGVLFKSLSMESSSTIIGNQEQEFLDSLCKMHSQQYSKTIAVGFRLERIC
jgi:hypothetical protein